MQVFVNNIHFHKKDTFCSSCWTNLDQPSSFWIVSNVFLNFEMTIEFDPSYCVYPRWSQCFVFFKISFHFHSFFQCSCLCCFFHFYPNVFLYCVSCVTLWIPFISSLILRPFQYTKHFVSFHHHPQPLEFFLQLIMLFFFLLSGTWNHFQFIHEETDSFQSSFHFNVQLLPLNSVKSHQMKNQKEEKWETVSFDQSSFHFLTFPMSLKQQNNSNWCFFQEFFVSLWLFFFSIPFFFNFSISVEWITLSYDLAMS